MNKAADGSSPIRKVLSTLPRSAARITVFYRGIDGLIDIDAVRLVDEDDNLIDDPEDLSDAAGVIVNEYVTSNHPGWEGNQGGDGTIVINLVEGTWSLHHREFYREYNDYSLYGEVL